MYCQGKIIDAKKPGKNLQMQPTQITKLGQIVTEAGDVLSTDIEMEVSPNL